MLRVFLLLLCSLLWCCKQGATPPVAKVSADAPNLVLITMDTTRADYLGAYGNDFVRTPVLDNLAASGTRFAHAIAPATLTLPSHTSLLTGLLPPEHGVRANGKSALAEQVPTLAESLAAAGYQTGAFVSSMVLDQRFGLDQGFEVYDDKMSAANLGEYGYPERDAMAVTNAALTWLDSRASDKPFFIWVHYYDPHSSYDPPEEFRAGETDSDLYAGEIAYTDHEIGRLIQGLPGSADQRVIAVVGDHGESLGEHGERAHGILLQRGTLHVPLILSGKNIPANQVWDEAVGIQRLTRSLLQLTGVAPPQSQMDAVLPGLFGEKPGTAKPIYSESTMPHNAYGWEELRAISDVQYRLVVGPNPELFDFLNDPAEQQNLLEDMPDKVRELKKQLDALEAAPKPYAARALEDDPEMAAQLRSLGYLNAGGTSKGDGIDPKQGLALMERYDKAKKLLEEGNHLDARDILEELVAENPSNIPFLMKLAAALEQTGEPERGLSYLKKALELNPANDFVHLAMAEALLSRERNEEGERSLEMALELNPRLAVASLTLAELYNARGDVAGERKVLEDALAAGTHSGGIYTRLGQMEMVAGNIAEADRLLKLATDTEPGLVPAWILWAHLADFQGQVRQALDRYATAARIAPEDPSVPLRVGKLYLKHRDSKNARRFLTRAAELGEGKPEGLQANHLLMTLPGQ